MDKGYQFDQAVPATSCRILARTIADTLAEARVVPGFVTNTYILLVKGKKPNANITVQLTPLTYVRQPEYWGIEVVACSPGILLPIVGDYDLFLPLDSIRGTKGIEVIWAEDRVKIDVPPTANV